MTVQEKLEKYTDRSSGDAACWEWQGGRISSGYGAFWSNGSKMYAHRAAWEEANGPIPVGMFVCHRCDNPACCNPAHLFLGTSADNTNDMMSKGRRRGPRGEAVYQAKMTCGGIRTAEMMRSGGVGVRAIAREMGVARSQIYRALAGKSWRHCSDG